MIFPNYPKYFLISYFVILNLKDSNVTTIILWGMLSTLSFIWLNEFRDDIHIYISFPFSFKGYK